MLSTFNALSTIDAFGLDRLVHEVGAPDGAAAQFGYAAAGVGDVNGDGAADFAIGAPGMQGQNGAWSGAPGAVYVYSGRDRSLIRTLGDGFAGFGLAMLNVGDLNGDGVADLAVGSPSFDSGGSPLGRVGRVWIFSGAGGAVIRTLDGTASLDEFGWAICGGGDFNADGTPDLFIGAPGAGGAGRAYVISGASGSVLHTFNGEIAADRFGEAVGGGVDTPTSTFTNAGDGVPDYIVGAPGGDGPGRAYVLDGASGGVRYGLSGHAAGDRTGSAVAIVRYTGPNVGLALLYLAGSPGADVQLAGGALLQDAGRVVATNASGTALDTGSFDTGEAAGDAYGSRIVPLPGLTGDETYSYAVFSAGAVPSHRLRLHAPWPAGPASAFIGDAVSIALIGDADGDGIADAVVGRAPEVGGAARIVPVPLAGNPPGVDAISDNGRFAILGPYVYQDGSVGPASVRPGLAAGDRLVAVNNAGLFFGRTAAAGSNSLAPLDRQFFYLQGHRTLLSAAVLQTIGPAPGQLQLVEMSNTGSAVFNGGTGDAYLFRAGVLTDIWTGRVNAINDAGVIVGFPGTYASAVMIRSAGGVVTTTPDLLGVAGVDAHGNVVAQLGASVAAYPQGLGRRDAQTGTTGLLAPAPPNFGSVTGWDIQDVDDAGRVLLVLNAIQYPGGYPGRPPPPSFFSVGCLYTPGVGLETIPYSDPFSGGSQPPGTRANLLTDGRIVYLGQIFVAVQPALSAVVREGSPLATAAAGGALYTAMINTAGEVVVIRAAGAATTGQVLRLGNLLFGNPTPAASDVALYTDGRDGRVYALVQAAGWVVWFTGRADGMFNSGVALTPTQWAASGARLAILSDPDGSTEVAAVAPGGDLILMYQTNTEPPDSTLNWSFDNLTVNHIQAGGQTFTPVVGGLTPLVAPWGANHLAYLDAAGHVELVWRAPGMAHWRIDDLSANAGAPQVHGPISAFVTSWGGLHVVGADDGGHLAAVWWVPAFGGQWRYDVLLNDPGAPALDLSSVTTFVTPWNAVHIVGLDAATGKVTTYWWTPATSVWQAAIMITNAEPAGVPLTGGLASGVTGSTLAVLGRRGNGHLSRLSWMPGDGAVWTPVDITALAQG